MNLEVVWNGTLEAQGKVAGLSSVVESQEHPNFQYWIGDDINTRARLESTVPQPREAEIMGLLSKGYSIRKTAAKLGVKVWSVRAVRSQKLVRA